MRSVRPAAPERFREALDLYDAVMGDLLADRSPEHLDRPVGMLVLGGLAAAVLVATTALARSGVSDLERQALDAVASVGGPTELIVWLPMQFGSALAPPVVAAFAAVRWRRWRPTVGALVVGLAAWWAAKVVKDWVARGRPADVVAGFVAKGSAPTDGLGFPSGHAAVAFALATVLAPYVQRPWRVGLYALATVVALARVHIGAHLPLDVVGGAALGVVLGAAWHLAVGIPDDVPDGR